MLNNIIYYQGFINTDMTAFAILQAILMHHKNVKLTYFKLTLAISNAKVINILHISPLLSNKSWLIGL